MGSKKRSKIKTDEGTAKRRNEDIRQLFDSPTEMTKAVRIDTFKTPTPTPTVPTEVTDAVDLRKTRTQVVANTPSATEARPPLRTVISAVPYRPAKRIASAPRSESSRKDWWLGPALIVGAMLLLALGWMHIERSGTMATPIGHKTSTLEAVRRETQAKIDFYRNQLGHRLNSDRVGVEILNTRSAPGLEAGTAPQPDKSMMNGVPLMQESYVERNYGSKEHGDSAVRYTSRDSTQPVPIDRPDARIQYGLQEEQHRAEFDRRVQQEYIREFVENARRDGVKVVLDQDANVISAEPINPNDRNAYSRTPGSTDPTVGR